MLSAYDQVEPGIAGKLVSMAQNNAAHRRDMERTEQTRSLNQTTLGMWMGFLTVVIFVASGTFLVYSGRTAEGVVTLGVTFAGVGKSLVELWREREANRQTDRSGQR